jgi:hypothetical protein
MLARRVRRDMAAAAKPLLQEQPGLRIQGRRVRLGETVVNDLKSALAHGHG